MVVLENTAVQTCGRNPVGDGLVGQSLLIFKLKAGRLKRDHLFAEDVYFILKTL